MALPHNQRDAVARRGQGRDRGDVSRCGFLYGFPMTVMANDSKTSNKPVKKFRFRGVSASVFENQTESGNPFYKTQIVRTYKDKDGFKSVPTYNRDELLLVMKVTIDAWNFILEQEQEARDNQDE